MSLNFCSLIFFPLPFGLCVCMSDFSDVIWFVHKCMIHLSRLFWLLNYFHLLDFWQLLSHIYVICVCVWRKLDTEKFEYQRTQITYFYQQFVNPFIRLIVEIDKFYERTNTVRGPALSVAPTICQHNRWFKEWNHLAGVNVMSLYGDISKFFGEKKNKCHLKSDYTMCIVTGE